MDSPISITFFNKKTRKEFTCGPRAWLGSLRASNIQTGTLVVLSDFESAEVFGIARVRNAPDTNKPCIEHSLLDADTYSMEYQKYNKYEIHVHEVSIFSRPMTFDNIRETICGVGLKGPGNIVTGCQFNFRAPFQKGADAEFLKRYALLINMLAAV
jgi:hypothetical protein